MNKFFRIFLILGLIFTHIPQGGAFFGMGLDDDFGDFDDFGGGFGEQAMSEAEVMRMFEEMDEDELSDFFAFMEEQGFDVEGEMGALKESVSDDSGLSAEEVVDQRELYLNPPTQGKEKDLKVTLSEPLINAYHHYATRFITEVYELANKARNAFGIDTLELDPYLATIETLEPSFIMIGTVGANVKEEVEKNVFLKEFFKPEYKPIRQLIVNLAGSYKTINTNLELIALQTEAGYSKLPVPPDPKIKAVQPKPPKLRVSSATA